MSLKVIAAVAENGVIGSAGAIPWKLADDMKWFKAQTGNRPVVMGSKTYWSLPARFRPLPMRENIVLTRNPEKLSSEQVTLTTDFNQVVERAKHEDIFVIGGAEIYSLALPYASELYLTRVHAKPEGDTHFPLWGVEDAQLTFSEHHSRDEKNDHDFTFEIWNLMK